MTTDELREKFEAWCLHRGINTEKRSNGHYLSDEVCFWWKLWSDAYASRDAEVEALRKRINDAPVYYIPTEKPTDEAGWIQVIGSVKAINGMRGKHVRLVIDAAMQEDRK